MADNAAQGAGENPRAVARARFVRVTPMKARRVIELIKGRPAAEALTILRFAPQAASEPVGKVLASAIANAENNLQLDPGTLVVSAAWADEGPTLKRFQPRAQGRAFRIRKRTSHITIEVESVPRAGASTSRNRRAARVGASTAPASAPTSSKGSAS